MMMQVAFLWKIVGITIIMVLFLDLYLRHFHGIRFEAGLREKPAKKILKKLYVFLWCVVAAGLLVIGVFAIIEQLRRLFYG